MKQIMKKTKKVAPKTEPGVKPRTRRKNHKTLKIILLILGVAVIFGGVWAGVFFATRGIIAAAAPCSADQLYEKVQDYNYAAGHSEEIESDIKRLLADSLNENTSDNYATALKAKAEYYFGLKKYYTAITAFKEYENYILNGDDMIYAAEHLAEAYRKFGNEEQAAKYQEQYDNLTRKCGEDTEESEEESQE